MIEKIMGADYECKSSLVGNRSDPGLIPYILASKSTGSIIFIPFEEIKIIIDIIKHI